MDKLKQDIAYFISFCVEQYKNEKGISGSEAMALLSEYGVLEYLAEHWEILHINMLLYQSLYLNWK